MRPGFHSKRQRNNRSNSRRGPSNYRSHTLDSNGPDVKVRGSANQICEKYQALARDASSSGDRIMAENYLQHAEHYYRLVNANGQGQRSDQSAQSRQSEEAAQATDEVQEPAAAAQS